MVVSRKLLWLIIKCCEYGEEKCLFRHQRGFDACNILFSENLGTLGGAIPGENSSASMTRYLLKNRLEGKQNHNEADCCLKMRRTRLQMCDGKVIT